YKHHGSGHSRPDQEANDARPNNEIATCVQSALRVVAQALTGKVANNQRAEGNASEVGAQKEGKTRGKAARNEGVQPVPHDFVAERDESRDGRQDQSQRKARWRGGGSAGFRLG